MNKLFLIIGSTILLCSCTHNQVKHLNLYSCIFFNQHGVFGKIYTYSLDKEDATKEASKVVNFLIEEKKLPEVMIECSVDNSKVK